jgi:drug/metabolite transporter (DMT)-like permease
MVVGTAALARPHRTRGYLETGAACLINGFIGVMVSYATMPTAMLLALRMGIALVILAVPFVLLRRWTEIRRPGVPLPLIAVGVVVAANLLLYFISIRSSGVSIAIFLSYLAPVYLAVVAPLVVKTRTEPVVWVVLGIALVGMATIVLPGAVTHDAHFSVLGLTTGTAAGICFAGALMLAKSLRPKVSSSTIVLSQCVWTTLLVMPLGLYQVLGSGYTFTGTDLLMAVMLGTLTTALSFTLFVHGMRYIKVQHSSIVGFLEPVSAPLYALLFLGEALTSWTLAGGALIIIAGVLLVVFGKAEEELYG